MKPVLIHSKQNPLIKHIARLKEARDRKKHAQFLIEGCRELQYAMQNNVAIEQLVYCADLFSSEDCAQLLKKIMQQGIKAAETTKDIFEKISHREGPDGLLAIGKAGDKDLTNITLGNAPLLLIAEGIEKPGNLGALIRTAEAVGCDALILTNSVIDLYNPNVIRASQGLVFSLPIAVSDNEATYQFLKKHDIQMLATTPHCRSPYWDKDYKIGTAILVGSEKDGLTDFWLKHEHVEPITIPHLGQADSLNAGIAAAVVLFEAHRQKTIQG